MLIRKIDDLSIKQRIKKKFTKVITGFLIKVFFLAENRIHSIIYIEIMRFYALFE